MSDFIQALLRQPVSRTPIWLMRQAGRYLPEYREVRAKAGDFMTLCQTPELACEVTMQPLARFDLDAAILFSDILTIPDAMGLGLHFIPGEGPKFSRTIDSAADIAALPQPDPEDDLGYVMDAVRMIQGELRGKVPLIGFAGSPWTIATYMVEGGSTKQFSKIKGLMYSDPAAMQQLMDHLAEAVGQYLAAQIAAGVDAVMIFDTWGGVLSPEMYQAYSLASMQKALTYLPRERDGQVIPRILFTKQAGQWLEMMAESDCDALGVDWTVPIGEARRRVGSQVALQGNLDPCVLYADEDTIRREVHKVMTDFGPHPGHVFNLGHGMQPGMNPDKVQIVVDAVHQFAAGSP